MLCCVIWKKFNQILYAKHLLRSDKIVKQTQFLKNTQQCFSLGKASKSYLKFFWRFITVKMKNTQKIWDWVVNTLKRCIKQNQDVTRWIMSSLNYKDGLWTTAHHNKTCLKIILKKYWVMLLCRLHVIHCFVGYHKHTHLTQSNFFLLKWKMHCHRSLHLKV